MIIRLYIEEFLWVCGFLWFLACLICVGIIIGFLYKLIKKGMGSLLVVLAVLQAV